jgi:hypothetical protein
MFFSTVAQIRLPAKEIGLRFVPSSEHEHLSSNHAF